MSTDSYVTLEEAATLAGVATRTIRNWKEAGRLTERAVARSSTGQLILLYDPHQVMRVEAEMRLADPAQRRARKLKGA